MPRDNDKNNDSRGRRDRPGGGKGRSGAARGPEKKFAKRGFGARILPEERDGEKRPLPEARRRQIVRQEAPIPAQASLTLAIATAVRRAATSADKPRFNRDRPRGDRPFAIAPRGDAKRAFKPRGDRAADKRPNTPT